MIFRSLTFACALFACSSARAQSDSLYFSSAKDNLVVLYTKAVNSPSPLYTGFEYENQRKSYLKGHPFFKSDKQQTGSVFYNGHLFTSVPLLYDMVQDQIVVTNPATGIQIRLVKEKVKRFSIGSHNFKYLSFNDLAVADGFYEVVYDNKVKVFARRSKISQERTTDIGLEGKYAESNRYFVLKNNDYQEVSDRKTLLNCFEDKRKELKQYARNSNLKFKNDIETDIVRLVTNYETLVSN